MADADAQLIPAQGSLDANGHMWFGEFQANKVGMFDTNTHVPRMEPADAVVLSLRCRGGPRQTQRLGRLDDGPDRWNGWIRATAVH